MNIVPFSRRRTASMECELAPYSSEGTRKTFSPSLRLSAGGRHSCNSYVLLLFLTLTFPPTSATVASCEWIPETEMIAIFLSRPSYDGDTEIETKIPKKVNHKPRRCPLETRRTGRSVAFGLFLGCPIFVIHRIFFTRARSSRMGVKLGGKIAGWRAMVNEKWIFRIAIPKRREHIIA